MPAAPRMPPRLVLVVPPGLADAPQRIAAACGAGDVASVLLGPADADVAGEGDGLAGMVRAAQAAGAAAILRGDTRLVGRVGADGFHAEGGIDALKAAVAALSPGRIVGAGGLRSRHDAMVAGEAGADYVFFGNPEPGDGRGNARDLLAERAEWWQAIFEVPCIAWAADADAVGPLAAAGADFVALGHWVWDEPDGAAGKVAAAQRALQAVPEGVQP